MSLPTIPMDHALLAVDAAARRAAQLHAQVRCQGTLIERLQEVRRRFHDVGCGDRDYVMTIPPDGRRDDDLFTSITVEDACKALEHLTSLLSGDLSADMRKTLNLE